MTLSDLVTDLPTSLALQKAGVVIETVFVHLRLEQSDEEPPVDTVAIHNEYAYESSSIKVLAPAYTAQELAEWLYELRQATSKAVDEYFWPYVPCQYTETENWGSCILSLIEKKIITLSPTTEK